MKNTKQLIISLFVLLGINLLAYAHADPSTEALQKEWSQIKREYPNFASMFVQNNILLGELIKRNRLKELLGSYTARSCQLGLLPKCPDHDPCALIKFRCDRMRNEGPMNPDGLDASEVNPYGECMIEYRQCRSKTLLCCK
jgi:hypothetical protein